MLSHHSYRMDNTVKDSVWGARNKTKTPSTPPTPVSNTPSPTRKGGSKYAPADRCCSVCASGLFLPRDMTDSGFDADTQAGRSPKAEEARHIAYARQKLERFEEEFQHRHDGETSDQVLPDLALLEMSEVKLGKKFGKGGSATVYEVTGFEPKSCGDPDQIQLRNVLMKGSFPQKNRYVLKKLSTRFQAALPSNEPYARACAINLVLEAQILRMLDHPNVLKMHAMGVNDQTEPFLILTCLPESMEERILHWRTQVKKHKKQLSHSAGSMWRLVSVGGSNKRAFAAHIQLRKLLWERMHVARDIALAVEHLHQHDVIYRDLKISNVAFDSSGKVKIFDFGISRVVPRAEQQKPSSRAERDETFRMSKAGTRMYTAPEILAGQPYGFKADVYSFGVILWQLMSVSTPKPILNAESHPLFVFPMCACWPAVTQTLVGELLEAEGRHRPSITTAHQELTQQLEKLKLAFTQQDHVPVLSKKKRGFGRSGTFELSSNIDMP